MVIKLTSGELRKLLEYKSGPFGEAGFLELMAGLCARMNEDSGEIDVDRDDLESINLYSQEGQKEVLDFIFKRPIEDALKRFRS